MTIQELINFAKANNLDLKTTKVNVVLDDASFGDDYLITGVNKFSNNVELSLNPKYRSNEEDEYYDEEY